MMKHLQMTGVYGWRECGFHQLSSFQAWGLSNVQRLKMVLISLGGACRASAAFLGLLVLLLSVVTSHGYSTAQFITVQSQIQNDIGTLTLIPSPTRAERRLLRSYPRGDKVLTKTSTDDGKTLRSLNRALGRLEDYAPALGTSGSNLLTGFNAEQAFVENLLLELPESAEATAMQAQFQKFGPTGAKLNAATMLAKFAGRYDAAKRKLDGIFIRANQALLIPFPTSLPSSNSVRQ